jgi:hypothetical protein
MVRDSSEAARNYGNVCKAEILDSSDGSVPFNLFFDILRVFNNCQSPNEFGMTHVIWLSVRSQYDSAGWLALNVTGIEPLKLLDGKAR